MNPNKAALAAVALLTATAGQAVAQTTYREPFRPQYHFSPAQNWMNDPNGLLAAPHSPENSGPIEDLGEVAVDQAYVGACVGAKIEDLRMAADVLRGLICSALEIS